VRREAPDSANSLNGGQNGLVLFALHEYVQAERRFIGEAIRALSDSRGGLVGLIQSEPTSRPGATRVTLESGETVEFDPGRIEAVMNLAWDDVAETDVPALLTAIDAGAEQHHDALTRWVLANLEKLTDATGNTVDASGRSLFDALYEMFEKIELRFEEDGSISEGFAFVMHPDVFEKMKQMEADMTPEQRKKLDDLIAGKRDEFFARRRRRELS
jgi:hypothetical protein